MCYVVAKDRNKQGCVALKSRIGKHLSEYTRSLNESLPREGIQIIVISRHTAYRTAAICQRYGNFLLMSGQILRKGGACYDYI